MFLKQTVRNNPDLIEFAFWAQQNGKLLPDSYLIDVDMVMDNGLKIMDASVAAGVKPYFMLKQAGRNPVLARGLTELGFAGAVAVDYKEALLYIKHGIPLGNVGHLVQVPEAALEKVLDARPEIMTVYSIEKVRSIARIAEGKGFVQPVMPRVVAQGDFMYPGQIAGISIKELDEFAEKINGLNGVKLSGVCGFPCFLYDDGKKEICPTQNAHTVVLAAERLRSAGYDITQVNLASANCAASANMVKRLGGTHMEPGHGLMGTTPAHVSGGQEKQAMVYMSEISHNFDGGSYCYGGGFYPRGNLENALVGRNLKTAVEVKMLHQDGGAIDYHLGMQGHHNPGDGVVMSFRSQVFVTRSHVALVKGLKIGAPGIIGVFDPLGHRLE